MAPLNKYIQTAYVGHDMNEQRGLPYDFKEVV